MFLAFLPEHACSVSAPFQLPKPGMQKHGAQDKLSHHQEFHSPGKSVLHTGSKVALKLAHAISVQWTALVQLKGEQGRVQSSEAQVTQDTAGRNPMLHSLLKAIFLASSYLVQCSHSSPETNPPQNSRCCSGPMGSRYSAGHPRSRVLCWACWGVLWETGKMGKRGRLWHGAAPLLLVCVRSPCAVLGRDTTWQTLTLIHSWEMSLVLVWVQQVL